jgi:hypothetical protein
MKSLKDICANPRVKVLESGGDGAALHVRLRDGVSVIAIVSTGGGWDHVSARAHAGRMMTRIMTWDEMEQLKRLMFEEDETAMQLHVPPAEHVNRKADVLHLWRPQGVEIPRPPADFV